jgi:ferredoxin-NADP reductase
VSYYACIRILRPQFFQQRPKRSLLHFCTGIGRTPFLVKTSLIDDAEGTVIVITCMNATDCFRKQRYYVAVAANIIMV